MCTRCAYVVKANGYETLGIYPPPLHSKAMWQHQQLRNSIAYRQGTSKREGARSVNQSISHKVIQKPPAPVQTPKWGEKKMKRV